MDHLSVRYGYFYRVLKRARILGFLDLLLIILGFVLYPVCILHLEELPAAAPALPFFAMMFGVCHYYFGLRSRIFCYKRIRNIIGTYRLSVLPQQSLSKQIPGYASVFLGIDCFGLKKKSNVCAFAYRDVVWIYFENNTARLAHTNQVISRKMYMVLRLWNNKIYRAPMVNNHDFIILLEKIREHSPHLMLGYTMENQSNYALLMKEHPNPPIPAPPPAVETVDYQEMNKSTLRYY